MKIAVTGKGGTGKTTFAAILARLYAAEGKKVLAVDADPDANLGTALGFTTDELAGILPISGMDELIAERTGADKNDESTAYGKFFKINPKVDDIPDKFSLEKNGIKLLLMGTVKSGGSGCVCPAHVMLKRVISHLVIARDEAVIMDMEAGLEHLGRGTAEMMDRFIVVTEPGERSVQTLQKLKPLAADLGVRKIGVVANKIRNSDDEKFLQSRIPQNELLGFIHYSDECAAADRNGLPPYETAAGVVKEISKIKERLEN